MKKVDANNLVLLRGALSSVPVERELPSGSTVVQLEVTTRDAEDRKSTRLNSSH